MIHHLFLAIKSSTAIRQSAVMTIGTTVTAIIMAVTMIIASRVLGPEEFGIFSVSVSLMGVLSVGTHLGLNQLIPRLVNRWHDQPQKLDEFVGYVLYLKIGLGVALLLGSVASIPFIISMLNFPHRDLILWAIIGALGIGWYEHVYLMLSARHRFTEVNMLSISQAVVKSVGFLGVLFVLKQGLDGIVAVYFLTPAIAAIFFSWLWQRDIVAQPKMASAEMRQTVTQFLGHSFVGVIAMTLITNVDLLLVQRELSSFDTGIYAGAGKIALFIGFVVASVGGVLNNRVARYQDKEILKQYLIKSLGVVGISLLGFIAFLPFAQLAIRLTVGPEYLSGTLALIILVLNAFLSLAVVPYTAFFYAVDHPAYFSLGGIIQVAIILLGNFFFLEQYGLNAAAWSRAAATIAFCVYTAVYTWYAWRKLSEAVPLAK